MSRSHAQVIDCLSFYFEGGSKMQKSPQSLWQNIERKAARVRFSATWGTGA